MTGQGSCVSDGAKQLPGVLCRLADAGSLYWMINPDIS